MLSEFGFLRHNLGLNANVNKSNFGDIQYLFVEGDALYICCIAVKLGKILERLSTDIL